MNEPRERTTPEKTALFTRYFTGRRDVYGTYDPKTGKSRQVKEPVTRDVILNHFKGIRPYGVYLLVKDQTRALAVDFDDDDPRAPLEFVAAARHFHIPAYIERSKSKGYHAWIFFETPQTPAAKARLVAKHILSQIERPETEVFPKQDFLADANAYGNFINAPLFGTLVPKGRTVFVRAEGALEPYPNQWDFLESIQRVPESALDEIIALNELGKPDPTARAALPETEPSAANTYGLLPCAQRMLTEGVAANQRVACFRLAVHLKRVGIPQDAALETLKTWARKNRPADSKRIITEKEIAAQTADAYRKNYRALGCEDPSVQPYCSPDCIVRQKREQANPGESNTKTKGEKPAMKSSLQIIETFEQVKGKEGPDHYRGTLNIAALKKTKLREIEVVLAPMETLPDSVLNLTGQKGIGKDGLAMFAAIEGSKGGTSA